MVSGAVAGQVPVTDGGPPPVEAQVLFADCRAPGPLNAAIGWKVKDVVEAPGSVPVARHVLQAVDGIGQAYVPDVDLARADRSAEATPVLKQVQIDGEIMLLAQFADAGLDRTGRASHTMHGLLHSAPLHDATGRFRRPVELFGAAMWQRPVGNDAVEAATVQGAGFGLETGPVDLGAVIGDVFLTDLDRPDRIALLPLVLEAFRAALDGEVTMVLVVGTAYESACWLALLSNLVDPVSASRLRFSTREDLLSMTAVDNWDYHLAAVVRAASTAGGRDPLAGLGSRFLVVDTGRPPTEHPDGSWTLADGSALQRTPWTDLAETVLMSPVVTEGVRLRLDELAADVQGLAAEPSWGLPVAALLAGADLPDRDQAVRWVFGHWPTDSDLGAELTEELAAALRHAIGESDDLATELSGSVGPGVPTFLADAVLAGAVRRGLAGLRPGDTPPPLRRPLSADAAAAVATELPELLAWAHGVAPADRLDVVTRVTAFAADAGLPAPAVRHALQPTIDAVARQLVDPGFDPRREGLAPIAPELWNEVFADAVSDALSVRDPDVEVSRATHEWLTPSLAEADLPETAARRHTLAMSAYTCRRAAWRGGAPEPWLSAVFAVGLMHVNTFRYGMPPEVAVRTALDHAFGGQPLPIEVAARMVEVFDTREKGARLAVAAAALSDGEFTPAQIAFAKPLQNLVTGDFIRSGGGPVYLHLVHDLLVVGPPARALQQVTTSATQYIGTRFDEIEPPLLRAGTRLALLGWGLRLPVSALRGPNGPAPDPELGAVLRTAVPADDTLDFALDRVIAANTDDVVCAILAQLCIRVGLAVGDEPHVVGLDPYYRYLARRDDKDTPLVVQGAARTWLTDRGKPGVASLGAAWDRAIDTLVGQGWQSRVVHLEADKADLLDILQSRSVLGRRRGRR